MKVRIVPHDRPLCSNVTWWKVQVRVAWLKIGRIKLCHWKTVGDYSTLEPAKYAAKAIVEEDMIEKD